MLSDLELDLTIRKDENRYYIGKNKNIPMAEITYYYSDDKTIVIDHTYVVDTLGGRGIGKLLLDAVVDFARQEGLKIHPVCSFAVKLLNRSPNYKDVLE
jgi:predicted GNAT family acetyltransferase